MDDQLEPRVSDDDREAAIQVTALALAHGNDLQVTRRRVQDAKAVVKDLISHGWGPKLTVSRADIVRRTASAGDPNIAYEHTVTELRAFGIEVTSG